MARTQNRGRDRYLTIRASSAEREMVQDLAANDGLTVSDWLRLTIRQRHIEAFADKSAENRGLPNGR